MNTVRPMVVWFLGSLLLGSLLLQGVVAHAQDQPEVQDGQLVDSQPPADKSLDLEGYAELGVPAADVVWTAEDYTKATQSLIKLARKDASQLPRYGSDKSGKLFARIINKENSAKLADRTVAIETRMQESLGQLGTINQLFFAYLAAFSNGKVSDRDVIEIAAAQFRLATELNALAEEFRPMLDKTDPTYEVRIAGFKKMKAGFGMMSEGALGMFVETQSYRKSELKVFSGHLLEIYPALMAAVPIENRKQNLETLKKYAEDPEMEYMRQNLKKMAKIAEKSIAEDTADNADDAAETE